jgi:uncharacterized DUF497 family protein
MFRWHPEKAAANLRKHGVSFEEAATVFADPDGLEWEDLEHSEEERRWKRLGLSAVGRVLLLVYTCRTTPNDKEINRIISARQANQKEREAYAGRQD